MPGAAPASMPGAAPAERRDAGDDPPLRHPSRRNRSGRAHWRQPGDLDRELRRTQIVLTILSPAGADLSPGDAPCVYWVHGGGTVMGDRYSQIDIPLDWLASFGAVVVCVDYRLAPDFPGTTLVMVDGLADRSHMRSTGVNDQPMSRRPTQLWGRVPPIGVDCAIDMARGRRSPTLLAVIRSQGLGPGLGYSGRNGSSWSSPARTTA
jgi:hypothetical protein